MTPAEMGQTLPHPPSDPSPADGGVRSQVERLVRSSVPRGAAASADLAGRCVDAFLAHDHDPRLAARAVASACVQFGEAQTVHGLTDAELTTALHTIGRRLRRQVVPVLAQACDRPDLDALSRCVQEYLMRIVAHVRQGMQTMERFHTLPPLHRRRALAQAAFGLADGRNLRAFAVSCGLDPTVLLTPVVSTDPDTPLGEELRDHDDVLEGPAPRESAVPATWTDAQVCRRSRTDVARGPVVPLVELPEAVRITRTTAGVADPGASVTRTRDVLARVMVQSSPLLGDLLVSTRLAPFEDLPVTRRAVLGRTVLSWLERGIPVNVLAREIGVPPQTIHTRVATTRRMLDDPLADPDTRLELLAALRVAVPRWEAEAAASA